MDNLKKYFFVIIFIILFFVVFIGLIVYGSQIQEIKPGDGFRSSFTKIQVDASNDKWTETGIAVKDLGEKKITIEGNISLCSDVERETLVHAVKCNGGSNPKYPSEEEFINEAGKVRPYATYNWDKICDGAGSSAIMDWVKIPDIKVSYRDYLTFSLIPNVKKIGSCNQIPKDIIFANTDVLNKQQCNESEMVGNEIERIISNDPSPRGNKVLLSRGNAKNWFIGNFADFRISDPDLNYKKDDIGSFDCKATNPKLNDFLRLETYELNEKCKFFARDGSGEVASYYDKTTSKDTYPKEEYAEMLVAKLGGNEAWGSAGELCLPKMSTKQGCLTGLGFYGSSIQNSLRLNYPYIINKNIPSNNDLFLIIGDLKGQYQDNIGGYNVKVNHSCPRKNGESLYLYIGPKKASDILISDAVELIVNNEGIFDLKTLISGKNPADKLFFLIEDNGDGYENNTGHYMIEFNIESIPTLISDIMNWLLNPIKDFLGRNPDKNGVLQEGVVKEYYNALINNGIRGIVYSLCVLFIVITSLSFVLGITEMKFNELFKIIIKIGLLVTILSDFSWNFLNKYLFNIFWFGAEYLITCFAKFFDGNLNSNNSYQSVFIFFDRSIGYLFNWKNLIRFFSLICSGFFNPLNWFIAIVIGKGLINILTAFFKGIILYTSSLIVSGFLIAIAPIFICFILFKNTFSFFDTWLKQLIMYLTVPVLFFIIVGFLNEILFYSIFQIFNFGAYQECLLPISFGGGLDICILNFPMPFANQGISFDNNDGYADMVTTIIPVSIMHVINFSIISKCYLFTLEIVPTLASIVFGGSPRFDLASVAKDGVNAFKYAAGMDEASINRRKANKSKIVTGENGKNKENSNDGIKAGFRKR